ncbi:hypothetical protein ACL1CA_16690, partial [Corynebacterium striatum]
ALAADTVVATDNALAEVAASDKALGNDTKAIQQDTPHADSSTEVSQVLFRLSRWENLEYAKKI